MILGQFEKKQEQKEILPQVDHKSPIFDRMHVKKEDIKCGCLQARTFLFHTYVWTEKEIRRDGWQVFCEQNKRPLQPDSRTAGAAGSPELPRGPDHIPVPQNGFFPPSLLEYFQLLHFNCSFSYL